MRYTTPIRPINMVVKTFMLNHAKSMSMHLFYYLYFFPYLTMRPDSSILAIADIDKWSYSSEWNFCLMLEITETNMQLYYERNVGDETEA